MEHFSELSAAKQLYFLSDHDGDMRLFRQEGIPDKWVEHGEQPELWRECGYDAASIEEQAKRMVLKAIPQLV